MRRLVRRVALMTSLALVSAAAGSALVAGPALAGGVDTGNGTLSAAVYNLTPYTWTLVAAGAGAPPGNTGGGWNTYPASTVAPGGGTLYRVTPWQNLSPGICFGYDLYGYDAYMTYRVNVLDGPPEYANVVIWGDWSQNLCFNGGKNQDPGFAVYFTSSPPPGGYDPWNAAGGAPAPQIANPQLTYQHNTPYLYDQSIGLVGNYTVDASTNLGAPFVDVLNSLCNGASSTSCSFTQYGPLTWGTGDPGSPYLATHCASSGSPNSTFSIGYTATQSSSFTVGGGVTVSVEFSLLKIVGNSVSVSVEASHQWTETATITRQSSVDIPPNDIAYLWVVPVVGKVTGTLVMSTGSATITATNFSETRSGVAKTALTPAYEVITKVRPMTQAELASHCQSSLGAALPGSHPSKPPVRLVPGQGVARVSLDQTPNQVARELGQPSRRYFPADPCQGLGRQCYAAAGTGGRWPYRHLSVVFGPNLRVSALIYTGAERSARGAGVGASLPVVLGGYPNASCVRFPRGMNCTVTGVNAGRTVRTVFSFRRKSGGQYRCNRVLIYIVRTGVAS